MHLSDRKEKHMDTRKQKGNAGEEVACRYLQAQGYRVLERNWCGRRGELDIVMEDNGVLVFVEVRTRASHKFGAVTEAVDARKQLQVRRVAEEYVVLHHLSEKKLRFDAVMIENTGGQQKVFHLPGAF